MSGSEGVVHVVGAGLAGLSAALRLTAMGRRVALYEGAKAAGGRCRSFRDARLGRDIDNGNHLILSGNRSALGYLRAAGAADALVPAEAAAFPFFDLADGRRWRVAMDDGPAPFWLADPSRRAAGAGALAHLRAVAGLAAAGRGATVAEAVRDRGAVWRGFVEPLTLAVLNAPPERASARLLWRVLRETFLRGGRRCRPMFAPRGLGAAFVAPALAALARRGAAPRFAAPLRAVEAEDGRAAVLRFAGADVALGPRDRVVLALPPARLRAAAPPLDPPGEGGAILNAHFVLAEGAAASVPPLVGVLGAETQWVFRRGDVLSVTISAAETGGLLAAPEDAVAATLWAETRRAAGLPDGTAPVASRVIREKRATFDQSPAGAAKRLKPRTELANLFLAGDHVDTGLPATIEGAIRSGETAATLAA